MTYRGTIQRGVVVFAKAPPPLKDRTAVRVEAVKARRNGVSSRKKRTFHPIGQ